MVRDEYFHINLYVLKRSKYIVSSNAFFGYFPKELRAARGGVYKGKDTKIVYPKLSKIKLFE